MRNSHIPRKRRWGKIVRRGLQFVIMLLIVLAVAGVSYQSIATAATLQTYPAPGQLITVNGHLMHIHCVGQGSPTVILEAGAYGFSLEWYWVQQQVSVTHRVCAYDRAGMGWSEPITGPHTLQQGADALHTLLKAANLTGPYILVGHSFGGVRNRVYATLYPSEVAGLVMVDTAIINTQFQDASDYAQWKRDNDLLNAPIWLLVRLGIARLTFPATYRGYGYPPEVAEEIAAFRSTNLTFDTYYAEGIATMLENSQQASRAENLGEVPVMVLWATVLPRVLSTEESRKYAEYQRTVAQFSIRSKTRYVEGADHGSILGSETYARQITQAVAEVSAVDR